MIKNQKGFTLTELIAGLALSTLLFTGFTMFMVQFVNNFKEIKEFHQLQTDLLHVIESIRYGYIDKSKIGERSIIGLLTAGRVEIGIAANNLTVYPVNKSNKPYWAKYYLDSFGQVRIQAIYDQHVIGFNSNEGVLFPSSKEKIKNALKYQVTNFKIVDMSNDKSLIHISIEGMVRFREKAKNQTTDDDLRLNTKRAKFESTVFLVNGKKDN
ncbi:MAG TPA: prepilin-type N-terminal cleavage/methylation domain-containing protein [Candidatus Cloacimonadota bacterium]|nr:prepilin-type N-terminal cleavage/methylation domain-containing protein [Candidatus Cloacimonadota bacterium]HOD54484.1 prepilin-type N-terminal cleavage/methylation domain-containing protein [Candidatus Cloacimonadota bacterium]HPM00565.1 prepilin-type N-terminal cleavage/methylation domain-containing protein [Candidatus Cloacimonadota bacterium]